MDQRLGNQLTALNYRVNAPPAVIGVTTRRDWEPTRLQRVFLRFLRSETNERSKRDAATARRERLLPFTGVQNMMDVGLIAH